ncbi:MAG: T9SS type A sorting domain-containing protein [Bacteroidota bacterium]
MNQRLLPLQLSGSIMCFLVMAVMAAPTYAQITVGESDFTSVIGQLFEANILLLEEPAPSPELDAIVAAEGENDTYDFSEIPFDESISGQMGFHSFRTDIPGGDVDHFSTADVVTELTFDDEEADSSFVLWSFSEVRDDGLYSLGFVMIGDLDGDGEEDEFVMEVDPPSFSSPLSYTFGDSWTMDDMFGAGETQVEVTGYGTLIMPDGSAREALRIRNSTEMFGFTSESIEFVTGSGDGVPGVSASVEIGFDGSVESVSFTEITGEVGTSIDQAPNTLPETVALEQNYPNPFNPETTITYELADRGHVTLHVFDLLGREVTTLVDGVQPAGRHTVLFDASQLTSGSYYYRIESEGTIISRVMTLLK